MATQGLRKIGICGIGLLEIVLLLVAALVAGHVARAQAPGGVAYARVSASSQPSAFKPGGHGALLVTINVAPGFHINSVKPADPYMIATTLEMKKTPGFSYGHLAYPANQVVKESYSPKPLLVYQGKAVIHVPVIVAASLKPGRYTLSGKLTYQGCNHTACFPPQTPTIQVAVTVK